MSKKVILVLIIFLASFLRLYKINTLPPALFADEVDAGYQAIIFNQNQTDYFGNKFPIHFRSFSDYRTALYIYSVAFFEKLTNNPELSVRLPSAFFSIFSVVVIYLLTNSLTTSFLLAISPWSIHYGRTGFEVSGMIFVILLGIYYFRQYLLSKKILHLLLSVLFLSLSPYFYSTAKFFLPIIIFLFFIIYSKQLLTSSLKHLIFAFIFGFLLLTPMLIDTFSGHSGFRFSYISIFSEPHREQITDTLRYEDIYSDNIGKIGIKTPFLSFIFHNKYQLVFQKFISNYFSSFSTNFLFLTGDSNPRHGFGAFGLLYYIDFFFVIIGIFLSLKKTTKLSAFFLILLILAPVPFALTRDSLSPHSTRLILMLPSLIFFSSLTLKKIPLFIPVYLVFVFTFWHYYQSHYPQTSAMSWHVGMKEAVVSAKDTKSTNLIFSDKYEPFLPFYLFYSKYLPSDPPIKHLSQLNNDSFSGKVLDSQVYFGNINFSNLSKLPSNSVFIVPKSEYLVLNQNQFTIIKFIAKHYINQEEFYLLKTND